MQESNLDQIIPVDIEEEMRSAYIDYAMSVIVSRALPDVRDGLKPVHRRVLYAMSELGIAYNKSYKKSARIVGECFVEGTLVSTPKGLIPIERLKRGNEVFTQNNTRKITELYEMPEQSLLEVKLKNGNQNTCTKGQMFKVLTPSLSLEWKKASDLKVGDYLVNRSVSSISNKKIKLDEGLILDEDLAYFLGLFLADGWIDRNKNNSQYNRISFALDSREVLERIQHIIKNKFDYNAEIHSKDNHYYLRISSSQINQKLINALELKGKYANNIEIPQFILEANSNIQYAFLSGFIDGDGSIHSNRNQINMTSISEPFILQAQNILFSLNIKNAIYEQEARPSIHEGKQFNSKSRTFSLEITSNSAKLLANYLKLEHRNKKENLSRIFDSEVSANSHEKIPFAGKNVFKEFSEKHSGGGWYKDANGEKFRAGIKYPNGTKIRYEKNLQDKVELYTSTLTSLGILQKLNKIGSGLYLILKEFIDQNLSFIEIKSITEVASQKTYDIQVEIDHEFIANGMLVHNCLGKYHPHGDTSVYDTMVRMAQEWSMRYPMVDGQGNFGSMDGDSPAAMRYCVVGDTLIKTAKGLQRIDSLVPENQANTTYNLNTKVLSLHKQKHKTSQFFHSGFHKTYLLQTKEGFKIEGTANHPVLTIDIDNNGKPQYTWKLLTDIKSDDKIIIERSQTQLNENQASLKEKNLALVAGCLVSEGFITDRRLGFNNVDKVYFDNFIQAYKQSIDNEFFYVYNRKLKSGKTIYEFGVQNQKGLERFAQSEIYKGLFDRKASEKRIPDYIFTLPKEAQKIFLQYLFEGDGSVSLLERNTINLQYRSQSLALLEDLQTLLLEFGVVGNISKGSRKEYKLCIGAFHNITKFYENVGFATAKDEKLRSFVQGEQKRRQTESIKYTLSQDFTPYISDYIRKYTSQGNQNIFGHKKNIDRFERIDTYKTQILHAINNEQLKYLFNYFVADRYYFATVESCELQAKEKAVYSVKVESDCHSFVANGFINHNTEARLKRISDELLADLNKETVDFQPNFDDSLKEPTVLPSKIPNLLVNGTTGIAVGMATVMAPHNLSEVVDGVIAFMENPDLTITDLIQYIPAPDFPTGAIIYGYQGVRKAFETGRGRVILRGKTDITTTKTGKVQIIATEIPYMINKATLIERTAQLVQDKRIEGISDIRDESDRKGLRIVYDLRKDAIPQVTLNQLYKYTYLQSSFSINNVALVDGRPRTLNLKDLIYYFVEHRHEVIRRRTEYELKQAKHRQHILEGLLIALDHLDEIIALIRASKDGEAAKQGLMTNYDLSEIQAKAILDMRLQRLTAMERDKIVQEHKEITALIARLEAILAEKSLRADIIKEELLEMKERYGDERRSEIVYVADEFTDEDMIPREDMVVSISSQGYIKRTSLEEYRTQGRGGVGSRGTSKTEEDFTEHLFVASTHDYILIFTKSGQVFWKKTYHLPEVSKTSRGRNIQNVIQIDKNDSIQAVINVSNLGDTDYIENHYLIMCTENGQIKKTSLEAFSRPRQNGIRAITIQEGDNLLDVKLTNGDNDIILAVRSGRAIRFHESKVRSMGRTASGVRGITLDEDGEDKVVGMVCVSRKEPNLLVVSENGYGKRSDIEDYRVTNRGGKGVRTLKITEKTGKLVAIKEVIDTDDLMIITSSGLVIRLAVEQMRVMGRATQGVKLIRLSEDDSISSVAKVEQVEGEENEESEEATNTEDTQSQADTDNGVKEGEEE